MARKAQLPDLVITDVRMPPGNTDDGLRAAIDLQAVASSSTQTWFDTSPNRTPPPGR
ncbi:hypothetical protein [Arthrobacter sp. HY1533]|uniref:hypothetical protein n=1 Tax=Arthrobacter sp. HY1533 TaxID=2970919 RepID=UPI0022BA10C4|nr:hypothetical protein [Arthrobacter sp. HY1533]